MEVGVVGIEGVGVMVWRWDRLGVTVGTGAVKVAVSGTLGRDCMFPKTARTAADGLGDVAGGLIRPDGLACPKGLVRPDVVEYPEGLARPEEVKSPIDRCASGGGTLRGIG